MFCKFCGKTLVDGDKFCRGCGKPVSVASAQSENTAQIGSEEEKDKVSKLPAFCKFCGKPIIAGYQFCRGCGTPIADVLPREKAEISPEKPAEDETKAEVSPEKPAEDETKAEVSPEKPAEDETKAEVSPEKPAEGEIKAEISPEKPAEDETKAEVSPENPTNETQTVQPMPQNTYGAANMPYAQPNAPYMQQNNVQQNGQSPYYSNMPPAQPKPPRKPLSKKAKIGIIGGGAALIVVIVVVIVLCVVLNNPINKMMNYIDSGSASAAKQLYVSSFKYDDEALAELESKIIEKTAEIKTQYLEGTLTYDEAFAKLEVITGFSNYDITQYAYEVMDYIDEVVESEENYEKAEEYRNDGDYLSAIYYYQYIGDDMPNYEDAQIAISECLSLYVEETISKAEAYIDESDYNSALDVIDEAIYYIEYFMGENGDDGVSELEKKREEYETEAVELIIEKADEIAESEGYTAAIDQLDEIEDEVGYDLDSETYDAKIEEYETAYINEVLDEAQTLVDEDSYAAAITYLENVYSEYRKSEFKAKIDEYEELLQTSLNDLSYSSKDNVSIPYSWSTFIDIEGTEQYYFITFTAEEDENATITYSFDGEYTTLSGTAVLGECGDENEVVTIRFVSSGSTLQTITLDSTSDDAYVDFEIDLTDVTSLTIECSVADENEADSVVAALINTVLE